MKLVLLILASSICILAAEFLKRKFSLPTVLTRRAIHIGTALVAGISPLFVSQGEIIFVSIVFAAALLIGRRYNVFSSIHAVERNTFGEAFLPLGVALSAFLFLPQNVTAFQFGIFIMGVSDALAGLVGERFGRHAIHFFGNKKSIEGSLTFFLASLILTFLFAPALGYNLLFISLLLTLIEFCLVFGLDNLVLPVIAAMLFQFLM